MFNACKSRGRSFCSSPVLHCLPPTKACALRGPTQLQERERLIEEAERELRQTRKQVILAPWVNDSLGGGAGEPVFNWGGVGLVFKT